MEKSADAFRTISEVAEDLDLPQHVLRFWETRFAQIKPLKRAGGRRFYRPDDIELLRAIRHLLYGEGYTIKGVQKILKEQGIQAIISVSRDAGAARGAQTRAPAPPVEKSTLRRDLAPANPPTVGVETGIAARELAQLPLFDEQAPPVSRHELSADARLIMQRLLGELLECQRILDVGRHA